MFFFFSPQKNPFRQSYQKCPHRKLTLPPNTPPKSPSISSPPYSRPLFPNSAIEELRSSILTAFQPFVYQIFTLLYRKITFLLVGFQLEYLRYYPPAFHPKMNKEKVLVFQKYWIFIGFLLKNIEQKNRG